MLSARSGSMVSELTPARFPNAVTVGGGQGPPTTVTVAEAPLARLPSPQLTPWPRMPHVPTLGVALIGATPSDSVSLRTTLTAVLGPALVTVSVDVTSAPATAGSGAVVLVIDKSAFGGDGDRGLVADVVEGAIDRLPRRTRGGLVDERRVRPRPRRRRHGTGPTSTRRARSYRLRCSSRRFRGGSARSRRRQVLGLVVAGGVGLRADVGPGDDLEEPGTNVVFGGSGSVAMLLVAGSCRC